MKNELLLSIGNEVAYQEQIHVIKANLSLTSFLLANKITGNEVVAGLSDLSPVEAEINPTIKDNGLTGLPDKIWKEAERRAGFIRPLAMMETVPALLAKDTAVKMGLSQRSVYTLIQRFRESGGLLISLAPQTPSGGRGKNRLPTTVEQIISSTLAEMYLSRQKNTAEMVAQEIKRRCVRAKVEPPSFNTIRNRIRSLSTKEKIRQREGKNATRRLSAVEGNFPSVLSPLDVIQIDHTPVDLIIVDEMTRRPIGRPFLTVSIDVYSRCITGFCLTLEAPSATSVGLCLVHSVIDKTDYLTRLGIAGEWPIWGKPSAMYVDNGVEFHSEALRRGCALHGIEIKYRPIGEPQYGGIVERLIGTLMKQIHTLPGTTFSNIAERGEYNSDQKAILTLPELEKWLTLAIIGQYHIKMHSTFYEPPIERYKSGLKEPKPLIYNKKGFLVDFLPIIKRSIQRHGFMADYINYYCHALQPWIAERKENEKFIIRRDPRDISCIYVLPPKGSEYIEVPYRQLSHPAVTLWEQKESLRDLKEKSASKIDEAAIFRNIEAMRKITKEAAASSRSARRKVERVSQLPTKTDLPNYTALLNETSVTTEKESDIKLFNDIEEWA